MSTHPVAAPAPGATGRAHDVDSPQGHNHASAHDCDSAGPAPAEDQIECAKQPPPVFLHSPPDSNNAAKTDDSDSELSDLDDDEPVLDDAPQFAVDPESKPELAPEQTNAPPETKPEEEVEDDIGEVLPAEWSGAVPIFRPTMDQFKDFNRFVSFGLFWF